MVAIDKTQIPPLVSCRADLPGEVISYNDMEIPIRGPAPARTLISITGVARIDLDTNETWPDEPSETARFLDVLIFTKYQVPQEQWVDGTATASLASIQGDDEGVHFFGIENAKTELGTAGLVQVRLTVLLQGDVALYRISFQAYILTTKVLTSLGKHNN